MVESDEKKCPHCAEVIKKEARVCRYCGRDLEPKPYQLPAWGNRRQPRWEEEVRKKAREEIYNAFFWFEVVPFIVIVSILAIAYVPQFIIEMQENKESKRFFSLERRIGKDDELSEIELAEYFGLVSARYGSRIAGDDSGVNKAVKDMAKRIDDETHTIWINPEEWSNWTPSQGLFIRNVLIYFFIKYPKTIPYCIIRSIEDDSVIATARGMTNRKILREAH